MGIRHEWADEEQIVMNIYIEFPWTWEEFNHMITVVMPIVRDTNHPCATTVNCSQLRRFPKDGNVLQTLLNVEKALPENVFASVVIAAPYMVSMFMNMLMKLRPRAKRLALFTQTAEEAQDIIYARYHELYSANTDQAS
ncbi:MAG: hypothetical protein R3E39_31225 [Anaerolineae bacterium]